MVCWAPMASGERYVGIDLGTTNSTAAMFDGENVTLIRNADGSPLTPSVVRINAKGQIVVGSKARRVAHPQARWVQSS